MKLLINTDDAAFLRQILQTVLTAALFDRGDRRKLLRLNDKLAASKGLYGTGAWTMKRKEIESLQTILARSIKMLETEIAALKKSPETPEEGTEEARKLREERVDLLELYRNYAGSVQAKLADSLGQNEGVKEYISQSEDKKEAANGN